MKSPTLNTMRHASARPRFTRLSAAIFTVNMGRRTTHTATPMKRQVESAISMGGWTDGEKLGPEGEPVVRFGIGENTDAGIRKVSFGFASLNVLVDIAKFEHTIPTLTARRCANCDDTAFTPGVMGVSKTQERKDFIDRHRPDAAAQSLINAQFGLYVRE